MVLKIQILSLLASFGYGVFFGFMLELNYKIIYNSKIVVRIFTSFLFILFHTLFYFLILMKINYGYVHIYFFICMFIGYLGCKVFYKKIVKRKKV